MFGTVARVKVKPGQEANFVELGKQWAREEFERSGQVAEMIFKLERSQDEYLLIAAFPDRETYFANAEHSSTMREYERMREFLVADPEWMDGQIVDMIGIGGI